MPVLELDQVAPLAGETWPLASTMFAPKPMIAAGIVVTVFGATRIVLIPLPLEVGDALQARVASTSGSARQTSLSATDREAPWGLFALMCASECEGHSYTDSYASIRISVL